MKAPWRIELLGGLRLTQGERVVTRFRSQKTGALLAYLAFHCQRSHPRDELIEIHWPERDIEAGRNSLRVALSSLRRQLEPPGVPAGAVILSTRSSVQLNPAACVIDVTAFASALEAAARAASDTEQEQWLIETVAVFRGDLLPGFFEDWILLERRRMAEAFHRALGQLMLLWEQRGDVQGAVELARRALSADPLREEIHRDLMRLLARLGQPEAALSQYRELEARLSTELGSAPEEATQALAGSLHAETGSERRQANEPLPTGVVTVLVADVRGAGAVREHPEAGLAAVPDGTLGLLRRVFRGYGGHEVPAGGGTLQVLFEQRGDALAAAVAGQRSLTSLRWPDAAVPGECPQHVLSQARMALHTGEVPAAEDARRSSALRYATRILQAAGRGQILLSERTARFIERDLPPGVLLSDVGLYRHSDGTPAERLFQVRTPDAASEALQAAIASPVFKVRLPVQFTRFFGRERELARLQELLLDSMTRLATLTGPAGIGKTRLALEVAARVAERWRGALWFVPLADLAEPRRLLDVVRDALGLPRSAAIEARDQVVGALQGQPALLLLDNFEHLLADGALILRTLLERVPTLTCLVTSRQRLDLAGEREFHVRPLPTPAGVTSPEQLIECASVQLFVDCAQGVLPDFQVTPANAGTVAALCVRLEGIPLALELAAARAQVLTPAEMLAHLERRLDLLVSRQRDAAARHRTLRAALEWSYLLLAPELQRFFRQLYVFRGGWSLGAAETVCAEPLALDYLEQLRKCSLVLAEVQGEETRFRMLETLREFSHEQAALEERAALEQRHAAYYLALVETAEPGLFGPRQPEWLEQLAAEYDNLRAVLAWSQARDAPAEDEQQRREMGLRLVGILWWFWWVRGPASEGWSWLEQALARSRTLHHTPARAKALYGAGGIAFVLGRHAVARRLMEESVAMYRKLCDQRGLAIALRALGWVALDQGDHSVARAAVEESLALYRALGDQPGIGRSLHFLGRTACVLGDFESARTLCEESLVLCRQTNDELIMSQVHFVLGKVAGYQGNIDEARALFEQNLALCWKLEEKRGIAQAMEGLAGVACEQGELERAARLFGAAEACRQILGAPPMPYLEWRADQERDRATVCAALGEVAFTRAWAAGRALTWDQAAADALGEIGRPDLM